MTKRQNQYLKLVIEDFISNGVPVSSSHLIKKYKLKVSSATIRSELNKLEKEKYLQKSHNSSGRIPTTLGYEYYANFLVNQEDDKLIKKINDIFKKRDSSIDNTLDQTLKTITEMIDMTLVTGSSFKDELLKKIFLVPINKNLATIVIVTSTGKTHSKIWEFNKKEISIDDLKISIRIFQERLIDTPLTELNNKLKILEPILSQSIRNHEKLIQAFIIKVFDFQKNTINNVYGDRNLIKSQEINRKDLIQLLDLIENKSIWSSIESHFDEDKTLKIEVRPDNISILSKKFEVNGSSKEISIIGTNRINYSQAKQIIKLLEKFLNKK